MTGLSRRVVCGSSLGPVDRHARGDQVVGQRHHAVGAAPALDERVEAGGERGAAGERVREQVVDAGVEGDALGQHVAGQARVAGTPPDQRRGCPAAEPVERSGDRGPG